MENNKDKQVKKLGSLIKRLRTERGWSQDQLAVKCGYTSDTKRSMISAIENGKTDLTTTKIKMFANAFGLTGSEFIGLIEKEYDETIPACDLVQQCYGKKPYEMVLLYMKLDEDDRLDILDLMKSKLKREKYSDKKPKKS